MKSPGKLLFKYRSFFPIPYFLFLLFVMDYSFKSHVTGTIIIVVGLILRIAAQGYTGNWTRGNEIKAEYIMDRGIFSVVRNPLYTGNYLIGLGITFLSNFNLLYTVPVFTIIFVLYYYPIIREEEKYLSGKFEEEYEKYREKVASFFPKITGWKEGDFSIKHALKTESSTLLTISIVYLIFTLRGLF